MSGTRTNEKLENLPNASSVMTADYLAGLGLLNFLDAADFGGGAENLYTDSGARSGNQISFRGLSSARVDRDRHLSQLPRPDGRHRRPFVLSHSFAF